MSDSRSTITAREEKLAFAVAVMGMPGKLTLLFSNPLHTKLPCPIPFHLISPILWKNRKPPLISLSSFLPSTSTLQKERPKNAHITPLNLPNSFLFLRTHKTCLLSILTFQPPHFSINSIYIPTPIFSRFSPLMYYNIYQILNKTQEPTSHSSLLFKRSWRKRDYLHVLRLGGRYIKIRLFNPVVSWNIIQVVVTSLFLFLFYECPILRKQS